MGTSWAGIALKSDSWSVCGDDAWATEIHACEGFWAASGLQLSRLRDVHDHGRPIGTAISRCDVDLQGRVGGQRADRTAQGRASVLQRSSLLLRGQSILLSLLAQKACQSNVLSLLAQQVTQRRSLDEIAEEQVRRGQIRRRSLDEI